MPRIRRSSSNMAPFVSRPQQLRIQQKFIFGKSIAQISREENRCRLTVKRIVTSDEMNELIARAKEEVATRLIMKSVKALEDGLLMPHERTKIGLSVLQSFGIIEDPKVKALKEMQESKMKTLTLEGKATISAEEETVEQWVKDFYTAAAERHIVFGTPLKMVEEVEDKKEEEPHHKGKK